MLKKVKLIIEVPDSDYCWDYNSKPNCICEHFDNYGGNPTCNKGFFALEKTENGIKKPEGCARLIRVIGRQDE